MTKICIPFPPCPKWAKPLTKWDKSVTTEYCPKTGKPVFKTAFGFDSWDQVKTWEREDKSITQDIKKLYSIALAPCAMRLAQSVIDTGRVLNSLSGK